MLKLQDTTEKPYIGKKTLQVGRISRLRRQAVNRDSKDHIEEESVRPAPGCYKVFQKELNTNNCSGKVLTSHD